MQKNKDKKKKIQQKILKKKQLQFSRNKYNSRKFFLAITILIMGFIPIIFKFYNVNFIQFFKEWCWLALGIFTVYTSGNIGQKFSKKNHNTNIQNNKQLQQDPEYNHQNEDGA